MPTREFSAPCPECGTPCNVTWRGLEAVSETGDETLASKVYQPRVTAMDLAELMMKTVRLEVALSSALMALSPGQTDDHVENVVQLISAGVPVAEHSPYPKST